MNVNQPRTADGKLAAMSAGELLVSTVNTEAQPEIAGSVHLRSIPTIVVFAHGREPGRMAGAMSAPELRPFAQRAVAHSKAAR